MSHRFTLDALKELIVARRDGEQGLRICIDHVRDTELRTVLVAHQRDCSLALQELQSLILQLGGDPNPRPPASAVAQRRWADLRAALACHDDGVILDECERGESRALEVYRNALDDPLPDLVRAAVLRQFEDVMTNHDQIRALRERSRPRIDPGAGSGAQAGQH
ncbi:MAG TPA: PA2169 family four-helix-bundle protein [Steroidobacteraceae bacterium]|nr:PA2169 family four-helix-bundle protein [Steroidobacteraceae bacterium]